MNYANDPNTPLSSQPLSFAARRLLAGLFDAGCAIGLYWLVLSLLPPGASRRLPLLRLLPGLLPLLFLLFRDGVSGRSPGKWLCGLRVWTVQPDGSFIPAGFSASMLRNWLLAFPLLGLPIAGVWAAAEIIAGRPLRYADRFAGTMVR